MELEVNDYTIKEIIQENGGVYNYKQLIEEFRIGIGIDIKYANE